MEFAPRGSSPDRTIPRFHMRPVEIPFKSREMGRPYFEDREFVEIIIPGLPKSTACEQVNEEHKARWPQAYDNFKRGLITPETGTPIEEWPILSVATVQNLKALNIRTVEDLAGCSDAVLQNLGHGALDFRRRAQAFLESAVSNAPIEKLTQENEILKGKIAALESQLNDILAAQAENEAEDEGYRPRRGRPPKAA